MTADNTRRRTTFPLMLTVLGGGFTMGLIPSGLLPANVLNIESAYGLSHAEVGKIIGLCMVIGGGGGGLLGGWVCSRIGAYKTLLIAFTMASVGLGLVGLVPKFYATVFGLMGYFFAAGFMGATNALAAYIFPNRQRGVTLLHGMNSIGKLFGPILASLFLLGAWRSSFLAAAVLPLILFFVLAGIYRKGDKTVGRRRREDGHPGVYFWIAVAGFALIAGSEIAVALWIPAYAQKVRQFAPAQANLLLSIFLLGLIIGRFGASGLSSRISSRRAIATCGALLIFAVPAINVSTYAAAAIFFFLFGLGFSAIWPSYFAHLSHVFPEHVGQMGGASVFSTQIGFAACAAISGRLAEIDLAYPMIFALCVMAVFVAVFFASPIGRPVPAPERTA